MAGSPVVAWSPDQATAAGRRSPLGWSANAEETFGRGRWHGPETVPQQRAALWPGPLLWPGLPTRPLPPTEGLLRVGAPTQRRPSVEAGGTVRRPCHNSVGAPTQ